jgi:hypothetical protein
MGEADPENSGGESAIAIHEVADRNDTHESCHMTTKALRIRTIRGFFGVHSATLPMCAGACVFAGAMCGMDGWGENRAVGLGFLTLAAALGVAWIARSPGEIVGTVKAEAGGARGWPVLAVLLLAHGLAAFLYCRAVPAGDIDCYTFQLVSEQRLVQGTNPYGKAQADVYTAEQTQRYYGPGMVVGGRVQVGLQYPPITLAWILPGYLLGDIRYSYVLAVLVAATALFALWPSGRNLGLAAFLLLNPVTFLVENRCWTEPMVLLGVCATVYAAERRRWWLPIALGLLLATKQYNFLLLPFVPYLCRAFSWKAYGRLMGGAVGVAVLTALPFAVWGPRALMHDLVLFHLRQPFRWDSLSFAVVWPGFQATGIGLVTIFTVWSLWRVRETSTQSAQAQAFVPSGAKAPMFAVAYGVSLLLFVATSKQAFFNYYFLIGEVFMLAAAAIPRHRGTAAAA